MTISDDSLLSIIKDHADLQGQKFEVKGSAFATEYIHKAIDFLPTVAQQLIDARAQESALSAQLAAVTKERDEWKETAQEDEVILDLSTKHLSRLRSALEGLVAEGEWTKVEDRLPDTQGKYLASDGSHVFTATYGPWKTVEGYIGHSWVTEVSWFVYYWCPLPSLTSPAMDAAKLALEETKG